MQVLQIPGSLVTLEGGAGGGKVRHWSGVGWSGSRSPAFGHASKGWGEPGRAGSGPEEAADRSSWVSPQTQGCCLRAIALAAGAAPRAMWPEAIESPRVRQVCYGKHRQTGTVKAVKASSQSCAVGLLL